MIGAAWDGSVGKDEVSALIARLVAERKLTSEVGGQSLSLTLNEDRSTFEGHERALIDKLFFSKRTTTSTADIKSHYEKSGFDPTGIIRQDLLKKVAQLLPPGEKSRVGWRLSLLLFLIGAGCLAWEGFTSASGDPAPIVVGLIAVLAGVFGQIPGFVFRDRVHTVLTPTRNSSVRAIKDRRAHVVLATKFGIVSHARGGPGVLDSAGRTSASQSRVPSSGWTVTTSTCTTSTASTRTRRSRIPSVPCLPSSPPTS